jgi:hypothetical protein
MESRREFLKKLGLFSSAVVATTIPLSAVASMVEKGIDHGQESILQKKIDVWYYKQHGGMNETSKYFLTQREAIIDELIWKSGWDSNPVGAMQNIAYVTKEQGKEITLSTKNKKVTLEQYLQSHINPTGWITQDKLHLFAK